MYRWIVSCVALLAASSCGVDATVDDAGLDLRVPLDSTLVFDPEDLPSETDLVGAGCSNDSECSGATPRCDAAHGLCVPCLPFKDNCPQGTQCVEAGGVFSCTTACQAPKDCPPMGTPVCCVGACRDADSDYLNCGGCGHSCAVPNASTVCASGLCKLLKCNAGFGDCDGKPETGCESNTDSDIKNCGACGKACNVAFATPACRLGQCVVAACQKGFADCDKNFLNECEVDLTSDPKNCGGCGVVCPMNLPNCVMSMCSAKPPQKNVGSFMTANGPNEFNDPPCYTCQETCAMLFGGNALDYSCSTDQFQIDHMAWVDCLGDFSHCNMTPVGEGFKKGKNWLCGMLGCSCSAYVHHNSGQCIRLNWCFR